MMNVVTDFYERLKNMQNKTKLDLKGLDPMLKYRGGKRREIKYIEKYIPDYSGRYIEPFFGGGALFFYLEPDKAIINVINK